MSFENYSDGQSVYARLALLMVGWAIAGAVFYALSTLLPEAMLAIIAIAAWAVGRFDRVSRKDKSLALLLCWITGVLTFVLSVAIHFTHWHEDAAGKLIFVGLCLMASFIFLDRRAGNWQS